MSSATPQRIGRFEIRRELGRGTMGVVYDAHDPLLGRDVALKTIAPVAEGSEGRAAYEARFFAEARAAARLSHAGIVVVHEVGRDPGTGTLYIALERLRGTTLGARVASGSRIEWHQAARIVARLAQALDHAHRHGVVHRDVKPENVMLLPDDEPKLMDFGIARTDAGGLTAAGEVFGTPRYMSPEQALGQPADARSDLFSLGAVLYLLLTGRHAFDGPNVPVILDRIARHEPEPPSRHVPTLPPDLDRIVRRALDKAPASRYQSGQALARDLEDLLAGQPPRHAAGGRTEVAPPDASASDPLAGLIDAESVGRTHTHARSAAGPAAAAPASAASRGLLIGVPLALLLVAALGWYAGRTSPPGPGVAAGAEATPGVAPVAAPGEPVAEPSVEPSVAASEAAAVEPAFLVIDFEHSLKNGSLRVWVDDELVVDEAVSGRQTKKLLILKGRSGAFMDKLEVSPGRHQVRVEVRWEDERKARSAWANFKPGATRRLEANLGGLLGRKNLSLEWR